MGYFLLIYIKVKSQFVELYIIGDNLYSVSIIYFSYDILFCFLL